MTAKNILLFLAITLLLAILVQAIGYIDYLMNKDFILANIEALPFRYKVAMGFGQWVWWTFLLSGITGIAGAFTYLYRRE